MYRMLAVTAVILLAGCGRQDAVVQRAAAIVDGDVCTVCGMEISAQPGPRAEAYVSGVDKPAKFGSTRDFFAFITQPDAVQRLGALYVQDAARIDWAHPSSDARTFTDARTAYYVAWQPLAGEMGPTFASFARKADAEAFVKEHGGAVLRFTQITPDVVTHLTDRCPPSSSPYRLIGEACISKGM